MRKSTAILRGVAALLAFIMLVSMAATTLTFEYDSIINKAFGIKTTVAEKADDADADANIYYPNEYGYDENALAAVNLDSVSTNVKLAEEGVVLLRNENSALPLGNSRVTLFGYAAQSSSIWSTSVGGGLAGKSADYLTPYNLAEAMEEVFGAENVNTTLCTEVYANLKSSAGGPQGGMMMGNNNASITEAEVKDIQAYESTWQNDFNDAAIFVIDRNTSEGSDGYMYTDETYEDGSRRHWLDLSVNEEATLQYLISQRDAGVFKKVIVLVGAELQMELDFLEEYNVDACLLVGHQGAFGCLGIAEILYGTVNPSGHVVDTYAANSLSSPAVTYAGRENTQAWSNYEELMEKNPLVNDSNGSTINYYIIYAEGIYVDYKYYETRYEDVILNQGNAASKAGSSTGSAWNYADEVVYPLGYGLSYTTFSQKLDSVKYNASDKTYTVTVTVTNTGNVAGKDVVQIYAQTPYGDYEKENLVEKASVSVVAYDKTEMLEPGASETLEITFDGYFLASYDTNGAGTYILSQGDYYLAIGDDCHDALNNILAAKGYTTANGMTAEGNADNAYKWTQDTLDTESYRYSIYNGAEITNLFDDADINYYGYDFTYLSRQDWEGTYPVEAEVLVASDKVIETMSNYDYVTPEDAPSVDSFIQGERAGISLTDMMDVDLDDDEAWDAFLNQMTVEEMANLMTDDLAAQVVTDLDIPGNSHIDAETNPGGQYNWVSHPITGRAWNTDLNYERGYFEGLIASLNGMDEVWFGSGNFHRTPFGGRVAQYFAADANLDYWNTYYEAMGMQEQGVTCCIKHFCTNDQETNRTGISTFLTEQALREIYARAFEGGFAGGALGTMTALGRIGTRLAKNYKALITDLLRGEWGFKGHVTSDGYVSMLNYFQNSIEEVVAGLDYSCIDTAGVHSQRFQKAIADGDGYLLMILRQAAKRNLYVMCRTSRMNGLGSGTVIRSIVPGWQIALMAVNLISALGFAVCTVWSVVDYCKKRKPVMAVEKEA